LALITPPVGVNLYVIKQMAPEGTRMSDIIRGVTPYVLVMWLFFILLLEFPEIVLWLPRKIAP
jgi:C4-dicarboxylate transporter DctM subunit